MRRPALLAGILGLVAIVLVIGTLLVGRQLQAASPECTVPRPPMQLAETDSTEPLGLDAVQLQHASTINAVGLARALPERARVIALATAWQESSLRNLDYGDRDSVGLFQQRESQGWGDAADLQDPVFAAGAFYDALIAVPDWQTLPLTEAAQRVQRSAHPDAYAKWEWDSLTLARAMDGTTEIRLSCRSGAVASTRPAPIRDLPAGAEHLTPRLAAVIGSAAAELGEVAIQSEDGGTIDATQSVTVTTDLPGLTAEDAARALAAWAVAHATSFHIESVTVGGDAWSGHTWRPAATASEPGEVTMTISTEEE